MTELFDAFISYGRTDSKEFAEKLQADLSKQELRVWFDFNDIPKGVDFQNQIDDGIEKASHFLFIISPHSINSAYCGKEIELAIKFNKRIIPLMHVEEINRESWLSRNPNGTDEEWELYKNKGKHTSFQNMHPTIGKINWVYFREDKDDYQKSFTELINLLSSHTDYVKKHRNFLVKALEWERNQKQTRYLLTGEEKQQAQAWLKVRFKDEQAPCAPTDLHCEYVTESIKNGNNLMTQVFLSYADQDRATMEKIRNSLRRESITVWTNRTDIKTGEAFKEAIHRGIEQGDNIVYLLSPDSVNSTYCQQEIDLALSLHKRIIPILVRHTKETEIPFYIRDLHYIDLTDNHKEDDYHLDESQLLKILYEDAAYYNEHKILLSKALKWKQQNKNPSILLRGYNLQSAKNWLDVNQTRTQHPPTELQSEFITESSRQPPLESLDVFISYSRADSDFARKLNDELQEQGKTTWFDQESIESGSDFGEEINRGIKACDNFLFILSPRSVNSPYCKQEVEYAASLNKRFVTLRHRQVDTSKLHPELAKIQWIDFNGNDLDFNANFNQLVRTLDTDREHLRNHTKWSQRALEWEENHKSNDLLLRGNEFVIAQNWLEETEQQNKKPSATVFQKDFIQASQNAIEALEKEEKHRQEEMLRLQKEKTNEAEARLAEQKKGARRLKYSFVGISMLLVATLGFFWQAKQQKENAIIAKQEAIIAKQKAEKAQIGQLNSVSRFSLKLSEENLKFDALLEGIKAGKEIQELRYDEQSKTKNLILTALQTAVYGDEFREYNRLKKHEGTVFDVAWSPDGEKIATASGDGTIKLWNRNGKEIKSIEVGKDSEVYSVSFSPDGQTIKCTSDKAYKVEDTSYGTIQCQKTTGKKQPVKSINSPDGKIIATANNDNTVKISNKQGKKLQTLRGHKGLITSIKFSPNGDIIATASEDNTVKLWSKSGKKLKKLQGDKEAKFSSITWSPDGKTIASATKDNTIKIWTMKGGEWKFIPTKMKHDDALKSVSFSPDGKTIASASGDTIKLWNNQWKELQILSRDKKAVLSVAWSPDGNYIASAGEDNTIKLWSKNSKFLQNIGKHKKAVLSVAWSPDGNYIASAGEDNTIKLWSKNGKFIQNIGEHYASIPSVAWSPDGNTIASGSRDNTIKLWTKSGKKLKTFRGHNNDVLSVTFSPDGKKIASASKDSTVKLWSVKDGKEPQTLNGHKESVNSVSFSSDGENIISASDDKTVILWNLEDLELDKLMEDACVQVKDYLKYNAPEDDRNICKGINSKK